MIVTRRAKCAADDCENGIIARREFLQNMDMFDPDPQVKIKGQLADELRKFKKEKMFCPEHAENTTNAIMAS